MARISQKESVIVRVKPASIKLARIARCQTALRTGAVWWAFYTGSAEIAWRAIG